MKKPEENNETIITGPRKLVIPDASGNGNHITMVINWSPFIKNCEYIKLIMPNGDDCVVQKDEFRSLMTMISTQEEAMAMGRQKVRSVRVLRGHLNMTMKEDVTLKKGQTYPVPYEIPLKVPIDVIEEQDDGGIIKAR